LLRCVFFVKISYLEAKTGPRYEKIKKERCLKIKISYLGAKTGPRYEKTKKEGAWKIKISYLGAKTGPRYEKTKKKRGLNRTDRVIHKLND